jgi:manganese oxidase
MKRDRTPGHLILLLAAVAAALIALPERASAAISCLRNVTADVVAIDKPLMYNRLGAANINGMMYALRRDVVNVNTLLPLKNNANPALQGLPIAGQLDLRPDKRHRPIVLRIRVGDCLTVSFQNLLTPAANPFNQDKATPAGQQFRAPFVDEQTAERRVGFHVAGLQPFSSMKDDGSNVGANGPAGNGLVGANGVISYTLYAAKEGVFAVSNPASTFGSDGNMGNNSNGLFGQVIVEPAGAESFRSQVFEEELRLAADANNNGVLDANEQTTLGQPLINYDATYPNDCATNGVWCQEGKAGLPIIAMTTPAGEIVHSEINGINAFRGANGLGAFPASTYPLESVGKRNPTVPNRLEPFRDFASVFHDESANVQAFPGFFLPAFAPTPVMPYVLEGVKDAFMINYGSGGIGSEIIANRLGVGPMHDCLNCAYEEFFLTSFTVGDPALTVDIPANQGLELCGLNTNTNQLVNCPAAATGRKANYVIGAEDPSNVHHSYTGDFVKFRNTHHGKEQHVFHLHNHQ